MATLGYYIRGSTRYTSDWALVRVTSRYQDEVVAHGLSHKEAEALYWQKHTKRLGADAAASDLPLGDVAPRR